MGDEQTERDWLIDRVALVISQCGADQFLTSPLVRPHPDYFPDEWSPDLRGVYRLTGRLMKYAHLDDLTLRVDLFDNVEDEKGRLGGYFAGIEDGVCTFGADAAHLGEPDLLAASMAHEVAHAFRHHKGVHDGEDEEEEVLTELTSVLLGFGIFAVNASYRYRSSDGGYAIVAGYAHSVYTHASLGYLPPTAMCDLLAIQLIVRGWSQKECSKLAGILEPNQRAIFKKACSELKDQRQDLIGRLGLPPEQDWPKPNELDQYLGPIEVPEVAEDALDIGEIEAGRRRFNEGVPVFRVRRTYAGPYAFRGAGIGFLLGLGLAIATRSLTTLWAWIGGMLVLGVLGAMMGTQRQRDYCSGCEREVEEIAHECNGCGGKIVRTLNSSEELNAAKMESWENPSLLDRSQTGSGDAGRE